jgi:hypothetical protein
MKGTIFWNQRLWLLFAIFGAALMVSCEDDETDNTNDPDNLEGEIWEPYQLKANTAFDYDFTITADNNEPSSSGTVRIEIGDPEVEVSGNIDGQDFNYINNSTEDINTNFIGAVSQSPIGMTLYQPMWFSAFSDQSIKVGSSWSYNYQGSSITFDVTDTKTIAGIKGFVVETVFWDAALEENINWYTCINQQIPLPLLASVDYNDEETYYIELTGYEE